MRGRWAKTAVLAASLLGSAAACSTAPLPAPRDVEDANDTGRTLAAKTLGERQLLAQLGTLPSGTPRDIAGASVLAEPPYAAASGRTCRAVHVTDPNGKPAHRLACDGGSTWYFVPDVFAAVGD